MLLTSNISLPTGGILHKQGLDPPFYYDDPRFSFLKKMGLEESIRERGEAASEQTKSISAQLGECKTVQEASILIRAVICERLAKGLQTTYENVDPNKPLHSYGVDSLAAVEIRSWIMQKVEADITLFDILSGASISVLAMKIACTSKLIPARLEQMDI